ncbi:MAG: hypothetical protein IPQ24_14095 [Anaeromyxobacter sp.]|nr:hypothetical protein [Anaeromyxobacter sp.]
MTHSTPRPSRSPLHPSTRALPRSTFFSVVGGSLGLVAFLAVALLPSVVYGGIAGMSLATGLFGLPEAHGVAISVFIALGIVSAVSAVAFLFSGLGAAAGASVGALTDATAQRRQAGFLAASLARSAEALQAADARLVAAQE